MNLNRALAYGWAITVGVVSIATRAARPELTETELLIAIAPMLAYATVFALACLVSVRLVEWWRRR